MQRLLLNIVLLFALLHADAQNKTRVYTYTTEQGLSENVVYSLLQDSDGFIWAGTHHGLNRFDGYNWKNFYHSNYDSLSLPDNVIYAIEQDRDSNYIWLSSGSGLTKFSKSDFSSTQIFPSNSSSRPGSYYLFRINDTLLAVNYMTSVGLLNTKRNTVELLVAEGQGFSASMMYYNFFRLKDGKVALNITNPRDTTSLYYIDIYSKRILSARYEDVFPFKALGRITNYFIDGLNHHWVLYEGIGWRMYDHTGRPDEMPLMNLRTSLPTSSFLSFNDQVWLASSDGIIHYDLSKKTFENITNDEHNILVNKIYCLIMDRQQNIWAGTFGGGLSKLLTAHLTTSYGFYNQPEILGGNMITGVKKLKSGNILVHDFSNYEIRDPRFIKIESGIIKNDIDQLLRLGLGYSDDEIKNTGKALKDSIQKVGSLIFLNTRADEMGRIYLPGKVLTKEGKTILRTQGVFTKAQVDKWKNTWVTSNTGLYKILPDNSVKGIAFPFERKAHKFLFLDAYYNGDSILWLGTQEGLIKMFLPSMKFVRFDMKNGLPDNYIYQIQNDQLGNIWVSTNRGLSCLDLVENKFRNFSKRHGLVNSEYNSYSSCKLNDSSLIFAGTAGIDFINPQSLLASSRVIPAVIITSLRINNQDSSFGEKISVPHDLNNWEFTFTTNDLVFPQEMFFRYRLRGASNEWVYMQGINRAAFSVLYPGNYVFEVQASFNKNEWSESAESYFKIRRPFYQTWWFIALIGIIVLGLVLWLFKYRLQQKLNLLNMRNRISRDLHDEVGSSLSGIRIFSQMAEEKIDVDPASTRSYLQKVQRYCETVLGSMNDIVWTINPENDRLIKVYRKLHSYALSVAEPHDVKVQFSEAGVMNDQKLHMEDRKNLYLIAKEAINNAIKYSECRHLKVDMQTVKDKLVMEIVDDGKGFNPDIAVNGNGLKNMKERAHELNAQLDFKTCSEGTSIKVSLRIP